MSSSSRASVPSMERDGPMLGSDLLGGYVDYIDGGEGSDGEVAAPRPSRRSVSRAASKRGTSHRRDDEHGHSTSARRRADRQHTEERDSHHHSSTSSIARSQATERLMRIARDRQAALLKDLDDSSRESGRSRHVHARESHGRSEHHSRHHSSSSATSSAERSAARERDADEHQQHRHQHRGEPELSHRAKHALSILANRDMAKMEAMGFDTKQMISSMRSLLGHSQPIAHLNRVSKTFGYCDDCREPDCDCCCVVEKRVVKCVGGFDGHPACLIQPLIFSKYGYVFGSSTAGPINFSLTPAAEKGSFLLAPLVGVLVDDFNDEFGFDTDTKRGNTVLIANLPPPNAGGNGYYIITKMPSDTAAPVYYLRRATPFADKCYRIREGSGVFVTLGDSAGLYVIDTYDKPCCGSPITFTLEETNYGDYSVGTQVYPACNPCTKLICADSC